MNCPVPSDSHRQPLGFFVTAGDDFHAIRQHERRVKPDAELPDQRQIRFLVTREVLQKFQRTAVRDRAQVFDEFVLRQTDARVVDAKHAGFFVGFQRDFQGRLIAKLLIGQLQIPHFVEGIGSIRDQLANRDLFILIQRMRQQMQQLLDLGLKRRIVVYRGFPSFVNFL